MISICIIYSSCVFTFYGFVQCEAKNADASTLKLCMETDCPNIGNIHTLLYYLFGSKLINQLHQKITQQLYKIQNNNL